MRRYLSNCGLTTALSACWLVACDLEVDSHYSKPDRPDTGVLGLEDGEAGKDADDDDEAGGDRGGTEPDAETDATAPDGSVELDATTDASFVSCSGDEACATDQYCSIAQQCVARCQMPAGCAGPRVANYGGIIAHGAGTLVATSATRDVLGNTLANGALFGWDGVGQLQRLVTGIRAESVQLKFVADGSAFLITHNGGPLQLVRANLGSGALTTLSASDEDTSAAWVTDNFIWWSSARAGGVSSLWRLARTGTGAVELVRRVTIPEMAPSFLAGSEELVVFAESWFSDLHRQSIDGSMSRVLGPMPGTPEQLLVAGDFLYFLGVLNGQTRLGAIELTMTHTNYSSYRVLGGLSDKQNFVVRAFQLRGDWAYWVAEEYEREKQEYRFHMGRTRSDLTREPERFEPILIDTEPAPTWRGVSVSPDGTKIVYHHPRERRLFQLNVPRLPCAANSPCPSGLSCQSDSTCQ